MISKDEPDNWEPDNKAVEWAKNLLAMLKDGGMWASDNGLCQVDHKKRTMTLILKSPHFCAVTHARSVKTFGALGYQLIIAEQG